MTPASTTPAPIASAPRWLTLVGLGEDGLDGLIPAARAALMQAELVVGGARHLALAAPMTLQTGAETLPWPSPLEGAFPAILARRGRPVAVLATGDPFFHGIGSVLAAHVDPAEMAAFPAPSAYALACARLGWAGQHVVRVSLHGRALARIRPHLHDGARILALSWDGSTPETLARLLAAEGFGRTRLTVMEAMGGPRERIAAATAAGFALADIDPLNTVALEVVADPGARALPFTPGLPDDWFESDGQITKREVRAVTLSSLRPTRGQLLWDVGAGSGSVGIEWMLADPSCRAVAVEPRADRAARVARNVEAFGVPDLRVVAGEAPAALDGLPAPDAVFIGGGAGDPGVIDACLAALKPGGRLVVNAVTLETQALLVDRHGRHGGDLVQLSVARADRIGGAAGAFRGLRPAMAVLQWVAERPHGPDAPDGAHRP
ncbi:precorrin-6y C5,15-methyltransferase (decarboxylating) subunit CbiE [Chthonobacter rhizosphaerae]|uniref:precorrin-6y C5,15-methyltransferase (decarboxylating) subunit CbiE n=1 Tax=Chthonobacter rhizosphaerae TaxID=2735553 RepID=UPI0015EF2CD7|nr:precorrin-6y C5,15-methyltransferase (decarboxylating) subunit CbiE [Chthonobacter rhizosphaerae]